LLSAPFSTVLESLLFRFPFRAAAAAGFFDFEEWESVAVFDSGAAADFDLLLDTAVTFDCRF
jgi:hypothetical protein